MIGTGAPRISLSSEKVFGMEETLPIFKVEQFRKDRRPSPKIQIVKASSVGNIKETPMAVTLPGPGGEGFPWKDQNCPFSQIVVAEFSGCRYTFS